MQYPKNIRIYGGRLLIDPSPPPRTLAAVDRTQFDTGDPLKRGPATLKASPPTPPRADPPARLPLSPRRAPDTVKPAPIPPVFSGAYGADPTTDWRRSAELRDHWRTLSGEDIRDNDPEAARMGFLAFAQNQLRTGKTYLVRLDNNRTT